MKCLLGCVEGSEDTSYLMTPKGHQLQLLHLPCLLYHTHASFRPKPCLSRIQINESRYVTSTSLSCLQFSFIPSSCMSCLMSHVQLIPKFLDASSCNLLFVRRPSQSWSIFCQPISRRRL